jgi:uncharacterized membrane protein YphA (DoxX/SURF4 family)
VVQAAAYFSRHLSLSLGTWVFAILLLADGLCLLVGYLTPGASLIAAVATLGITLTWFPVPDWSLFQMPITAIETIAMCAAIGFLGPGAFSLDARLFGWREITIPPAPPNAKS